MATYASRPAWELRARAARSARVVVPLGLGLLWVAFDKRKQGWHDKLAGTVVIRSKNPVTFEQAGPR